MGDQGCTEVCKKCDKLWGTPTTDCYRKKHNLLECKEDIFETLTTENIIDEEYENVSDDDILQRDNKIPGVILIHVF